MLTGVTDQRDRVRWSGIGLALVGLVWTAVAGMAAGQYVPGWFDPDDGPPCALRPGGCGLDGPAASLRALWWWVGAGGLVVAAGVALTVWALDPARSDGPARRLPAVPHALAAAVLSPLVLVPLAPVGLFLLLVGGTAHVLVALLLLGWLAEAAGLAVLDHAVGERGLSTRGRAVGSLAAAALAVGVTAVDQVRDPGPLGAPVLARHVAALALAVLVTRFLVAPAVPGGRGRAVGAAVGAGAVLAVAALVLVPVLQATQPAPPDVVAAPPSSVAPDPTAPPVTPTPTPPPTPPLVTADAPCAQSDLDFSVGGFDAAMGARAASLVATNTGTSPCWLEGVPVVVLLQGGRPLALQVGPGETPEGTPAESQRVGVAPGGTALALLSWRSYGGWADQETPQAVSVALDPSTTLVTAAMPADPGPAPFDLADGGAWGIAPWAPPWN
jgi:Protein of unknown function (DUF4232)